MFENNYDKILALATTVFALLASLGLKLHPVKGHFLSIVVGEDLGMIMYIEKGVCRALAVKLKGIAILVKGLLCRAASNKRMVSVKALASLAGKAHSLHMPIHVARFFLRELHNVVKSAKSWSGTVKITCQSKRGLEWWTHAPPHHNKAPILKPIENAYTQCDYN